ncbi:hydrogenase iron-sulfur subunit [Natrialbaceae archaeon AArc-T1-2]|uniref:hydrogenase iron-sulfur subunit n=1 Tax=Natrialbaceae archaeon AArc-T1-2 TaxID=3053904 RepID=UPI00255A7D24|nr:hydrogenase iron-sulfur subunit [Natrialbaceae archaeon AArc-T1-2]WIV66486.1 hydrogenase iron-sulfur subunit [Natrialbaceae archaeon AArc-T1-2]
MTDDSDVGAFVCSCADTCDVNLDVARERVDDVAMAASSDLLCGEDTLGDVCSVVEERDLTDVIVTCPAAAGQQQLERVEAETGATVHFVDQREGAGWVHDERAATEKTARLVNAARASLVDGDEPASVGGDVGRSVAVVGDAQLAAAMPDSADVSLIADGQELDDVGVDLSAVSLERGRVRDVSGTLGNFEVVLESRVTEDCIDCMECVRLGPDDGVTRTPVDVDPDVDSGEWVEVCPTDAIDLEGVTRTVPFDQVVHPDGADDAVGGTTGYHTDDDLGTIAAVSDLLGLDRGSYLELEPDVCAAGDSGQEGCRACYDACPHDAVSKPAPDEVSFDLAACQNCGACTSSCPTGAVELTERSSERIAREVEALVDEAPGGGLLDRSGPAIDEQVVAFVCSERAERALSTYGRMAARGDADVSYPPILPVRVNCTDTVGEAHVLHALAAGADGVTIVGCGCDCSHSGPDPKAELVERLNTATSDLGLGERVRFLAPEPDAPAAFADELAAFVDDLEATPIPAGEHAASGTSLSADDEDLPAFGNRVWALESVRAILEHVEPERELIRGLESFGTMSVDDSCGMTPTCENLCPTGAIRRSAEAGTLEFNHERCVNCELCESGCPETAITMETGLDVGLLPEENDGDAWTTVHEEEMFECRSCGAVVASVSTVEEIKEALPDDEMDGVDGHMAEYCSDCKGDLAFKL